MSAPHHFPACWVVPAFFYGELGDVASGYGKIIAPVVHCACVGLRAGTGGFAGACGTAHPGAAFLVKRGTPPQSPGCQCSLLDVSTLISQRYLTLWSNRLFFSSKVFCLPELHHHSAGQTLGNYSDPPPLTCLHPVNSIQQMFISVSSGW